MNTGTPTPSSFRAHLQEELLDRCRKNKRYSLRSFAQSLKIGSSDLSKIIHGKRGISPTMLTRLGRRLDLDPELLEVYRKQLKTSSKAKNSDVKIPDDASYRNLSLEMFYVVSDWYPLAILEMTKIRGFVSDPAFIARCMGITVNEVMIAIERLTALGMMSIDQNGNMIDCAGSTTAVTPDYTDVAKRKYQKQILTKAIEAVDSIPVHQRDQSSMLMAVDSSKLPEARQLIKEFRRKLCALMEAGPERDQVMFLSVSLFPVVDPSASVHSLELNQNFKGVLQ